MQELLQQIDLDYYRSAQLLIVHAELEQLRKGRSAPVDIERQSKIRLGTSRPTDSNNQSLARAATIQSVSPEVNMRG